MTNSQTASDMSAALRPCLSVYSYSARHVSANEFEVLLCKLEPAIRAPKSKIPDVSATYGCVPFLLYLTWLRGAAHGTRENGHERWF